ncbi:hypothetical protein L1987_77379 [Smallanthus sonchifolius]|uniref:Uncharacterized protein n=1 Tax=Smallanthus sonchifolius TaxID=185202 RepID=A0ACB8Z9U2_9ASTR|nr:hypothetical protein L1987_77379 [Smallanthus sonchifolius]
MVELMVELMVIASMWESMAAWFTPAVLFCVTNLIIATVFIASTSNKHHHHDHGDSNSLTPLARVSSFLDRARSIKLSSYTSAAPVPPQSKTVNCTSSSRLAQSIHLSYCYSRPPEFSESEGNSTDQISNSPGQLARAPSFLDRVKSFRISSAFKSGPDSTPTENVDTDPTRNGKSEKTSVKKSLVEMKKSRSEVRIASDDDEDVDLRRPATTRERRDEFDEEVDAKADDFISRFKQQLKLQRLESLVRYNEMLNRRG